MKNLMSLLLITGFLVLQAPVLALAENETEPLPELEFKVPADVVYKAYLGLTGKDGESFTVQDIDADVLLIELFSMYCPYCQREAPNVNELYGKMKQLPGDGPKVRIIGIGASNSQFEVEHFRDTYGVEFPLFPDKDMVQYKALKGAGTPGFIGVLLKKNAPPVIVLRNSGGFYVADDFLKELLAKAGY